MTIIYFLEYLALILAFSAYLVFSSFVVLVITLNSRKIKEVYKIDSILVYLVYYLINVVTCFFVFREINYNFALLLNSGLMMGVIYYFSKLSIIGITGGIACGKSTISKYMSEELKIPVIDTDQLAREVVMPGKFAYNRIVSLFGVKILDEDRTINRPKLGEMVFKNKNKRILLNFITHPAIYVLMVKRIYESYKSGINHIALEIPLLFETKIMAYFCYPIITIYVTDENIQKERLMARNSLSSDEADRRIRSQMPIKDKIRMSHVHICNDSSEAETKKELTQKLPYYFSF